MAGASILATNARYVDLGARHGWPGGAGGGEPATSRRDLTRADLESAGRWAAGALRSANTTRALDYNGQKPVSLPFVLTPPQTSQSTQPGASARGTVIVVHGLWMTGAVCALQRAQLARCGYRTFAFSYPSIRLPLDEIASRLAHAVSALRTSPVHVVAHSLGGLVVLDMLALHPDLPVGRVVLLATPCAGSRTAQRLAEWKAGRALIGKAILQWQPDRGLTVARTFEIGMIAGTRPFGLGQLVTRLPAPHDGAVCVDETRLPGLRDHLSMPVSHSGMIVSARVARQICSFLEQGHFTRG